MIYRHKMNLFTQENIKTGCLTLLRKSVRISSHVVRESIFALERKQCFVFFTCPRIPLLKIAFNTPLGNHLFPSQPTRLKLD